MCPGCIVESIYIYWRSYQVDTTRNSAERHSCYGLLQSIKQFTQNGDGGDGWLRGGGGGGGLSSFITESLYVNCSIQHDYTHCRDVQYKEMFKGKGNPILVCK